MRFTTRADGDIMAMVQKDISRMERSHTIAMRRTATDLKAAWRTEIKEGGLGNRLSNAVRSDAYPKGDYSANAAAMVWTRAPEIVASHDNGTLIRSAAGFWLAIPLPAAGKARFGRRMTPLEFERRTGQRLRFIYRKGRNGLLVVDDARLSTKGHARRKGGKRRKDGILSGAQTVPVFVLVPQVKMRKRTDLIPAAEAVVTNIPALLGDWTEA